MAAATSQRQHALTQTEAQPQHSQSRKQLRQPQQLQEHQPQEHQLQDSQAGHSPGNTLLGLPTAGAVSSAIPIPTGCTFHAPALYHSPGSLSLSTASGASGERLCHDSRGSFGLLASPPALAASCRRSSMYKGSSVMDHLADRDDAAMHGAPPPLPDGTYDGHHTGAEDGDLDLNRSDGDGSDSEGGPKRGSGSRPRKPHLQGRFSGRLETKQDEKRLANECRLLGPLLGGAGRRGEKSRLTLAKIVRGIASGEVRDYCEKRDRELEELRQRVKQMDHEGGGGLQAKQLLQLQELQRENASLRARLEEALAAAAAGAQLQQHQQHQNQQQQQALQQLVTHSQGAFDSGAPVAALVQLPQAAPAPSVGSVGEHQVQQVLQNIAMQLPSAPPQILARASAGSGDHAMQLVGTPTSTPANPGLASMPSLPPQAASEAHSLAQASSTLKAQAQTLKAHAENLHVQSYHPSQTRMHVKVQSLNTHAKSLEAQAEAQNLQAQAHVHAHVQAEAQAQAQHLAVQAQAHAQAQAEASNHASHLKQMSSLGMSEAHDAQQAVALEEQAHAHAQAQLQAAAQAQNLAAKAQAHAHAQAHAQAQAQSLANQAHNLQAHAQQLDVESTFGHSTPGMAQPQAPVGQQAAHVPLPVLPSPQQQPAPLVGLPVQQQQQGPVVVLASPLLQQVVGSAANPFLQQGGPAQGPAGGAPPQQQQDQRPPAAVDGQQQVQDMAHLGMNSALQGMSPGFLSRALPPGTLTVHMMGLGQLGSAGSGAGLPRLEGASCSVGLAGTGAAVHADGSGSMGVGSMGSGVHGSSALQTGPLARQGSTGLPGRGSGVHASSTPQARHLAPQVSRGLPGIGGGGTVHASSAPQPGVMALQGSEALQVTRSAPLPDSQLPASLPLNIQQQQAARHSATPGGLQHQSSDPLIMASMHQAHSLAAASMQPHNLPSAASLASVPRPTQQPQAMDALDRALSDHMEMHAQGLAVNQSLSSLAQQPDTTISQ